MIHSPLPPLKDQTLTLSSPPVFSLLFEGERGDGRGTTSRNLIKPSTRHRQFAFLSNVKEPNKTRVLCKGVEWDHLRDDRSKNRKHHTRPFCSPSPSCFVFSFVSLSTPSITTLKNTAQRLDAPLTKAHDTEISCSKSCDPSISAIANSASSLFSNSTRQYP